jgi:hypothetical protein
MEETAQSILSLGPSSAGIVISTRYTTSRYRILKVYASILVLGMLQLPGAQIYLENFSRAVRPFAEGQLIIFPFQDFLST